MPDPDPNCHVCNPPAVELISIKKLVHRHVRVVIAACGGNKSEAARVLGIDRRSIYRKLKET